MGSQQTVENEILIFANFLFGIKPQSLNNSFGYGDVANETG